MHDAIPSEELEKRHRWFAIECNNRAWRLSESSFRTPAEDEEMLHAAHASVFHWSKVGTEIHRARGLMLLAHVHALLGDGDNAKAYAQQAFDYVTAHESADWEVAFAHAILANAASAAGEQAVHRKHYGEARRIGSTLPDEERSIFEATIRVVPVPAEA